MSPRVTACRTILLAALLGQPAGAQDDDAREGYYYPPVTSDEVFDRDIGQGPPTDRVTRIAFVTGLTQQQGKANWSPRIAVFAKGAEADHLIVTALDSEIFETLFRARAVLAQLTASARQADIFVDTRLSAQITWFDLVKLLGFEDLVVTDGETWSHRVVFE